MVSRNIQDEALEAALHDECCDACSVGLYCDERPDVNDDAQDAQAEAA